MNKNRNVVMLPTVGSIDRNKAPIFKDSVGKVLGELVFNPQGTGLNVEYNDCEYYHLHITSDEDIKSGDWVIRYTELSQVFADTSRCKAEGYKKIIATTNSELIINQVSFGLGIGTYDSLPSINDSFIQAYIKAYNEGNPITEVQVEYETKVLQKPADVYAESVTYLKLHEDGSVITHVEEAKLSKCIELFDSLSYTEQCVVMDKRKDNLK